MGCSICEDTCEGRVGRCPWPWTMPVVVGYMFLIGIVNNEDRKLKKRGVDLYVRNKLQTHP
jgi:hypothetical protein